MTPPAPRWLPLLLLFACKASHEDSPQPPSPPPSDAGPAFQLDACRAAASHAQTLPPHERAQAVLAGCEPCGSWDPLLRWNTPAAEGGPSRAAIEQTMTACNAYCEGNARQRFLGTLDDSRGQRTRQPWRLLGETCKAAVSAVPDTRYMSAPYFALDRIARALAGTPAVTVELPAVSLTGVGVELPSPAAARTIAAGPAALTVDASQLLLGTLPTAALTANGIQVAGDYPGPPTKPAALAAALAAPSIGSEPVAVLAPAGLPASRIAAAVAAAGGHNLRLAIAAPGPIGWQLTVALPIALVVPAMPPAAKPPVLAHQLAFVLDGTDASAAIATAKAASPADLHTTVTIRLGSAATTASLADLLAALVGLGAPSAALVDTASTHLPPPRDKPAAP